MSLLKASELHRTYTAAGMFAPERRVPAVNGVDLEVAAGERVGVVGESGSGKSTLLRLLLALEAPDAGSVHYRGRRVRPGRAGRLSWFRSEVQMVPQDPWSSLNPRMRLDDAIAEPLRCLRFPGSHARRVAEVLRAVELDPETATRRPGEFSGGQRQRIAIARALAPSPRLLLADEPVTALDASSRSRVLGLLRDLVDRDGLGLLLVSHDLAVVRQLCDRVLVMRDGSIVERGSPDEIFASPQHDHTRRLLNALPRLFDA